jgi:hypothetical protein
MPNQWAGKFEVSVSELNKPIEICTGALDALSRASQIPKAQRESVRNAVRETCGLVDSILTPVKQELHQAWKAVMADDPRAEQRIADLAYEVAVDKKLENARRQVQEYRRKFIDPEKRADNAL